MRVASLLLVCVLTAAPAAAQGSRQVMSAESMSALLASSDPVDQAWGAWMAGRLVAVEAAPQLERVIRDGLAEALPARVVIALDALIEIGARTTPQLLKETADRWPVQSLLLLSRLDATADPVLLSIMSESHGYAWFAAANMLHRRKAPGLAVQLLKGMAFVAELVVSNEGGVGRGEGGVSASVGDMAGGVLPGYPPWTVYQFRACDDGRLGLLAAGPTNVCYEKARLTAGRIPALSSHDIGGPSADDRLKYFAREVNFPLTQALQDQIRWTNDAALKRSMAELVGRLRTRHATLIRTLNERGWLSDEEGRQLVDPVIRERIIDLRKQ